MSTSELTAELIVKILYIETKWCLFREYWTLEKE